MQEQINIWWLPLSFILVLTYLLQINLFLHPDMMYLLHAAKLLLAGGSYTHDFFETNPPLIMYLYMPALWAAKLSGVGILMVFRLYILGICLMSLSLCTLLIQKLTLTRRLRYVLLYSLPVSLLFLPAHEFGQREHLFMLCAYPYIFSVTARLENKSLSPLFAFAIGLFAAPGIALKPFFLTLPLLMEGYCLYKKRSLFAVIRIETLTIFTFLCLYMAYISHAVPDYFQIILPIVSRLYFIGLASWHAFFTNFYSAYALSGVVFFLAFLYFRLPNPYPATNMVLFLALTAFVIAFAIPHAVIYYHVVPALGTAYVLFAFIFAQLLDHAFTSLTHQFSLRRSLRVLVMLVFPLTILSLPIYAITNTYATVYQSEHDPYARKLFDFFNAHAPHSSYMYLSSSDAAMLFHYYANGNYVGRYPSFWWEAGLQRVKKSPQVRLDEVYLVNMITQNLLEKNPRFVLMDTLTDNTVRKTDYITEFNEYPAFRKAWMNYHYQTTIGRFKIYEHRFASPAKF